MSFDIKAAREICSRIKGYEDPDGGNFADFQAAEMLPAALEEIERLQKALALKIEQHKGQAYVIGSYLGMLTDFNELNESQAKRIAELESENENLREWGISNASDAAREKVRTEKQLAALKKLGQAKRERGKALVEERTRGNHYGMSYEDTAGGKIERWIIDGEIDAPKVYIERMRVEARSQLRREGKL